LSGHAKNKRAFPPVLLELYGLFWQPSLVHDTQFPINLTPVTDRHRPLFRGLKGGQTQGFEQRRIAWKYASLATQLPVSDIQTLNGIGGINDLTYLSRKLEDWRNSVPVLPPAFHVVRILLPHFSVTRSKTSGALSSVGEPDRWSLNLPQRACGLYLPHILRYCAPDGRCSADTLSSEKLLRWLP